MVLPVLLLLSVCPVIRCFSSGLVMDSCEDMRPRHSGQTPQTGPSPFTVTTERSSFTPGDRVKVNLQAPPTTPFIGFLLQAREVGGWSAVGSYTLTEGAGRLLTCSLRQDSAVSHQSDSAKNSIQVMWRSSGNMRDIQFQYGLLKYYLLFNCHESHDSTKLVVKVYNPRPGMLPPVHPASLCLSVSFVENFSRFWVDVTSDVLTSTGGSETPPTATSPTISPARTITIQPAPPAQNISSADCGVSKVCFSHPSHCDPTVSAHCYFLSAMMLPGAAARYEMSGPSDGYVSFGFSDDQMMGDDDIYICGVSSVGLVRVQHAFSRGQTAPQLLPLGNVSDVRASVQDGVIRCSFTSMNIISTQRTSGFNRTYHLLFAHGPSSSGQIQFHTETFISTDKINISRPLLVRPAGRPHILKAHGALMLISWMTSGSVGMMAARYLKAAGGQQLFSRDGWFVVHVAVMSVTVAATFIASILSFSHVQGWSEGAHPVLGCLVLVLSVLQPVLALLRCGPQHPLRFVFNWSHALNGAAIKALAVAAIFTGLKLIDSSVNQWLMKVMGGFVGWELLFYFLLEVHLKWKFYSKDTSTVPLESTTMDVDVLLVALFLLGNIPFLVALLAGIGTS
ncbi:putative ferric-chelate reductase 1 [Brachyistius frenatus]|uniref:putative ferric-chelate reductase 1 n=1 Tax=Brachyistius frenatus TaxID=100188 RepID=UPI0037E8D798